MESKINKSICVWTSYSVLTIINLVYFIRICKLQRRKFHIIMFVYFRPVTFHILSNGQSFIKILSTEYYGVLLETFGGQQHYLLTVYLLLNIMCCRSKYLNKQSRKKISTFHKKLGQL